MALQTRPQQVGTARNPLKMDFNPGHGEPGSQRVGSSHRGEHGGSTSALQPSLLLAWLTLPRPWGRGVRGEGEGPVMALAATHKEVWLAFSATT